MLIIHADRSAITNFNNAKCICLSGRYIHTRMTDNTKITLAAYESEERAKEVFLDIVNTISQRRVDVMPLPEV